MRTKIILATTLLSLHTACRKDGSGAGHQQPFAPRAAEKLETTQGSIELAKATKAEVSAPTDKGLKLALPPRNSLPLTPASWCSGLLNANKITKQIYTQEAAVLCANGAPTPQFTALINSAYTGTGDPVITPINVGMLNGDVQLFVAYAMKLPKPAVQALLGEEKHVPSTYDQDNLKITAKFVNPPPSNNGDADTAFNVEQYTEVNDVISFRETSKYELKMYRLHPNNFDFFMAARTLLTPTTQFRKAVVLRAIMSDPADPKKSIALSVLNFVMNDRNGNGDNVRATFERFVEADMLALYKSQTTN